MNQLVSIIIPNYNSEKYIESTINSVISQTYANWELIVVDDKSTDKSPKIIKELQAKDDRIKLFILDQNFGGPAKPRNRGLKEAKGEYIAFLDSDDIWHPEKIKTQLDVMVSNNLDFLATGLQKFSNDGEVKFEKLAAGKGITEISHEQLLRKNFIPNSSVLVKKNVLEQFLFSEKKSHIAIEDYIGWLYLHQQKNLKSAKLNSKLLYYRLSDSSISKLKWNMAKKVFIHLSEYKYNNRPLGLKRYFYFLTYIWRSLFSKPE